MFYTGLDPRDMSEVYVPRDPSEKAMQRALMQYFLPQNQETVIRALKKAGREDLIGFGPKCLVQPMRARYDREEEWKTRETRGKPLKQSADRKRDLKRGGSDRKSGGRRR